MTFALALCLAGLQAGDLPFYRIGQVDVEAVPAVGRPRSLNQSLSGAGVLSPSGMLACFAVVDADDGQVNDMEFDLKVGVERRLPAVWPSRVRRALELLTPNQANALGAEQIGEIVGGRRIEAPLTVAELDDGRRIATWTSGLTYGTYALRLISIVPRDENSKLVPAVAMSERTPKGQAFINIGSGSPWIGLPGGTAFETVELRRSGSQFLIERTRIDLRRAVVTRRAIGRVPANFGLARLGPESVSFDGSSVVLHGIDAREIGKGSRPDSKSGTYLWHGGKFIGPLHEGPVWIWRGRFLGYTRDRVSGVVTLVEYTSRGARAVASGWRWLAANQDGSNVLAVELATGKPYLLTFR